MVHYVVVDAAAMEFVGKYLEDVPMTDAVDHANVDAIMDCADGYDFVNCAVIDDFPTVTMKSVIDVWTQHDAAFAMDYPI